MFLARIDIYTTILCPFCFRAKKLLDAKGVKYNEIDVTMNRDRRHDMMERSSGRSTVPQIFIGDVHVGGCDELFALETNGKLDSMLEAETT
jgi:glutaredoxin 3